MQFLLRTQRVLRDPTAYYHVLYQYNSNNATPDLRQRIWINGDEETVFASRTNPSLALGAVWVTNAYQTQIGTYTPTAQAFNGFLADLHHFDGLLVDPSVFGRKHPIHGEWIPRQVAGVTYPGRSFHLDFADENALGNDVSGNSNDFAQKSIDSGDAMVDVPANTFPIGNTVMTRSDLPDFSEAGLTVTELSASSSGSHCTHVLPAGRWHWAVKKNSTGSGAFGCEVDSEYLDSRAGVDSIRNSRRGFAYVNTGAVVVDAGQVFSGTAVGLNDVVDIYVDNTDPTNIKAWFAVNGVQQGNGSPDPATGADPVVTYSNSHPYPEIPQLIPGMGHDTNGGGIYDFGQRRGSESFIAATPAGFKRVSTGNFPVPTGPALQPKKYFGILQYEGDDATARTIIDTDELQFVPDMVWLANLDAVVDWRVAINMADYSPSPATPNNMATNTTGAPSDLSSGNIEGFQFGGFDVADGGTGRLAVNTLGDTYQAWCWKADPAAGFDIVRYTGDGVAGRTVAHNLGVPPRLYIVKRLSAANEWAIYAASYGRVVDPETDRLFLNSNGGAADDNLYWNDTAPTDSAFSLGTSVRVNGNNEEYVALLFTDIPGFLKIPSYEGNANANGPFVPAAFCPKALYTKNWSAGTTAQLIQDEFLDEANYNERDEAMNLDTNNSIAGTTNQPYDITGNGVKRRASGAANGNNNWHAGFMYAQAASKFARAK